MEEPSNIDLFDNAAADFSPFSTPSDATKAFQTFFIQDEKKESESVAVERTGRALCEACSIDDSTAQSVDRMKHFNKFAKSGDDGEHSRRSRRSIRSARRKRGESLERQISQLILGTASSGAEEAHFEVRRSKEQHDDSSLPIDFILQDLTILDEERSVTERSLRSGNRSLASLARGRAPVDPEAQLFSEPRSSNVLPATSPQLDRQPSQEYDDPSLEIDFSDDDDDDELGGTPSDMELGENQKASIPALSNQDTKDQEQGAEFASIESFESLSWREVDIDPLLPMFPSRSLSPAMSTPSPAPIITPPDQWANKRDPPTKTSMEVTETQETQRVSFMLEEQLSQPKLAGFRNKQWNKGADDKVADVKEAKALFKANFEDWTPFEPTQFSSSHDIRFSDTLVDPIEFEENDSIDENGFLVTQPQQVSNFLQSKSPLPVRGQLLDQRPQERKLQPPSALEGRRTFELQTTGIIHPNSPDSIFDYPNASYAVKRNDPPRSEDLQLPVDRFARIVI